jgi:hypothetical protein
MTANLTERKHVLKVTKKFGSHISFTAYSPAVREYVIVTCSCGLEQVVTNSNAAYVLSEWEKLHTDQVRNAFIDNLFNIDVSGFIVDEKGKLIL